AKNDEVLEAEVIEEVGLNEPMKFLEFQQRKLLTYIKENTPLRLLEHKKELKTRDILNFLEQSALNGKQKVFLMRNLERDLGKLELKIKENESVKAKIKNTYEISQSEAKELGEHFNFKGKKPLLRELRENEIKHALKSHGNKESEEARGNIAITLQDIEANYPKITQEFDEKFFTQKGVIYVKQVNGHHIVIEEALSGQDKLIFKTMWKTKGNYNKEVLLKNAKTSPYPQNADEAVRLETISKQELEQSNPQQSHLSTDESIAQNSEKLPFEMQVLDEDKLSGDEVRLLANKIGEKSSIAYFKDYLLKMDKNFHARAKDIIREYYKIEPFRKELENQWENVKEAYKNGEMSLKEFKFLSRYKDEKGFLNQVAGVLWLQNDELVKKRGYTYNEYGQIEEGRGANYYNNLALEYGKAQTALKKWFYYIQKANKQAQRFFNKKELEDLRANEKAQKLEAKGSEDIIFTDKKGKEHTLTKETQKAWLEAFNLKSLDEEFIPNLPRELKEALGKEIKLTKGSLYKIVEKGREKYIPQMKQTLQNPDFALRDRDNMLILAKQIEDKQYFTSVNLETKDYFISVSNAPKKENILKNKVENGAEILYQSPNAKSIFYTDTLLQTDKSSANKIDEDIIAQNAKSERAEFESFKDKIKELYAKYEGLSPYDKSTSQLRSKLLNEEIKPEIKKEFKNIIDKFKGADNKDKILRVIKENKEELSDYLAFNIALRKDIYIDGQGEGNFNFYDKLIRGFFKLRENKRWSEISDDSNYIALAALENLSNKNTSLYFSFKGLNGKIGEIKTYPRIQDLLFYDLTLGYDLKNAVFLSTKDKRLKEKLIEKLKAYIDKKIYADFLEYKIKDMESRNPKNSYFENYKDEKWDEEALKSFKKELEDLRANEKAQKLEAKGSEDIIFTDKKGKEHTLTKETQKAWLEAFNLKSLEDSYIPNHNEAIKQALEGKEIKLQLGSLKKLVAQGREKYIPQIKEVLDRPEAIMRDDMGEYLFIKHLKDDDYFVNVSFDNGEYLVSISNGIKETRNLNNKLKKGGEFIYQSPNFNFISQKLLQTSQYSANKIDEDIIAQNAKSESEKEVLERQIPFIEAEIQKYEAKIASLDERIKKTQTRIQPYLDEINALQKQYDELYFTETRGEEANAKKWLKLEEIKAKQEELRKPYNDALFKFVFPHQRLKGKVQTEIQKLKFGLQDRALRLEEIQNEALNTSKAQKAWLEAFNLKSLDEEFIPNFKAEVKEALKSVLGGEEIRLTKGSLIKLIKEKRLKYLDRIKPTLENPHSVILQNDGALIFARDYGEEKYFTSVARNDSGEWIIRSNAPKSKNGLNNKILNGGKEIYNDQAASQINASNPYDDIANSNIKLDNESIAENADYLELVKEYGEENAKSIIKQKILGENIAQVLENEPVRIRYFKQEAKERKPKETKPSADKTLGQIQKDMSARLKELKAQAKENYERYKNEDKALQKELTNTKDLFKAFEKEFNETEGTILISRAKRRKNDAEGKVETSVFLGNELALRNALDRWERYSGYSEENALEVKERLELLRSYVKRLEKHREDIKAKREQLEQDYQQNEAARSKEMGVIGNYNILSNLKGVSENELYEPFLEKVGGYLSKADFYERHLPFVREEFQKLFNITPLKEFGTNYAEFYRDGKGAVEKLLAEKQGQVAGAFYKEGLGEIDLVWGEAGSGKSDGFGLAKIVKYHPEVIDKLDDIIANTSIVKESDNRYHLENENYKLAIRKDFEGKKTNWLLTAFEKKDSIARRRTDLPSSQSEAEKTTSANANEIIPQEIEQAEIKKLLEEYGEQISSNYPQETARLILEQNKNDGIVLSGFKIKGKSYDPEIEAMQFKTKKAEREFESLMKSYDIKGDFLNFKEAYSFKPNDEAFLQYLAKYEGDENAKLALAYNLAKQLVMRRGGGRAEVYTTDFLRQMHILENQNSTTLHSNPHLGAGLVGGTLNGVEQDENGNLSFDPVKFAMGFLGGSGGSFALKKGFQILEKNPELKEKIINELADTLAQGFEKAREKYPLLNLLEPRYIVQNEKGRKIQAKTMLKELQREQKGLYNVAFNGKNAVLIKKDLEAVDEAILFEKGTKRKGGKHIRLAHSTEPSQEGYVTKQEVANLGVNIREYLKNYEPFIDKNGARLYEWKDENGVKFRAVVNNTQTSGGNSHLPSASEEIITFYSDRNLKEKMNFKNPLLKDTIAQASMQGEALSKDLEKSFLDESGRIAYKSLMQNAEKLPKELNLRAFREQFKGQKYAIIKTPIKDVKINTDYAFYHLLKSGNGKENRKYISGGILATLQNPLFVTKDERGSYYFYKPFKINENLINLVSVEVDKNDKLLYKTSYEASKNKLKSMIEKYDLIYFAGGIQPVRAE
ncbi:hypothetical protein R0U48_000399, partial [Campylobacter upsaliensis]|nr:hypothetical protein [Campylobacter upsaliensis]